jgi:RNA polymerase sigma-70 factor, ECF subfamily
MMGAIAGEWERRVHVGVDLSDFGSWMASEQRRIYLLCRRLLQDAEEADSATQDVFLKAYQALQKSSHKPAELEHPDKWVTRIAVNTCLDRLRSKAWKIWRRRPPAEDERVILEMIPGSDPDAERQLLAKQIQQKLEGALQKLSGRQRAVFSLRHYDAMALEEIADVLNLDTGTVKAHLFRAIGKLREELKDLYTAGTETKSDSRLSGAQEQGSGKANRGQHENPA